MPLINPFALVSWRRQEPLPPPATLALPPQPQTTVSTTSFSPPPSPPLSVPQPQQAQPAMVPESGMERVYQNQRNTLDSLLGSVIGQGYRSIYGNAIEQHPSTPYTFNDPRLRSSGFSLYGAIMPDDPRFWTQSVPDMRAAELRWRLGQNQPYAYGISPETAAIGNTLAQLRQYGTWVGSRHVPWEELHKYPGIVEQIIADANKQVRQQRERDTMTRQRIHHATQQIVARTRIR